jgi:hypothetical protein
LRRFPCTERGNANETHIEEVEMEPNEEGTSLKKRLAVGVAAGVATTAAAGVAKKLMANDGDDQSAGRGTTDVSEGGSQPRSAATSGKRTGSARSRSRTTARSSSGSGRSSAAKPKPSARAKRPASRAKSATGGARRQEKTKEQLYRQAQRLKIEGRSKMTKQQLQRAVDRARS